MLIESKDSLLTITAIYTSEWVEKWEEKKESCMHCFLLNALLLNIKHIVVGIWKCCHHSLTSFQIPMTWFFSSLLYNAKEEILKNYTKTTENDLELSSFKKEQIIYIKDIHMTQYESHSAVVHKYHFHFCIFKFAASYLGMRHKCMKKQQDILFSMVKRKSYR